MNIDLENQYKMDDTPMYKITEKHFKKLDVSTKKVDRLYMINCMNSRSFLLSSDSSSLGFIGMKISGDKFLQKEYLKRAGISVTQSKLFLESEKEQAKEMAKSLSNAVVKPLDGNQAKGVSIGVEGDSEFDIAWDLALKASRLKKVLIEENFQRGILGRYLVIDGKCISVVEFTKPYIIGNGKDTIEELIHKKNETRKLNPHLKNSLLVINENHKKNIKEQGYHLLSIPKEGEKIVLDYKANPKIGSDTVDITDKVHPLFKKLAEKAIKAIPGLYVAGVDLLALDHTIEPNNNNYRIIEMNNRPGLGGHLYTLYGYPRNVVNSIEKHIFRTIRINSLTNHLKKSSVDCNEYIYSLHKDELQEAKEPNNYIIKKSTNELIENEFEKLGYQGDYIKNFLVIPIGDELIAFNGSLSSNFSLFAKRILENQYWSRKFLTEDNLSIPEGKIFKSKSKQEAFEYAKEFNMHVQLEYRDNRIIISSEEEFDYGWETLVNIYNNHKSKNPLKKRGILITRFSSEKTKARYLIIDGFCVGVIQYIQTPTGNIETFNITSHVHPKLKKLATAAANIVLGVDIVGVDITSKDHFKDPDKVGYEIVNLKVKPSIKEFHYPTYGDPLNVAKIIANYGVNWAFRKRQLDELILPFEEAEIMPEKILNHEIYSARFIVSGKVQDIGFKKWVKNRALELGIDGYCKNRWDGKVEFVVGSKKEEDLLKIKKLLEKGQTIGQVKKVVTKISKRNVEPGFLILDN